VKLVSLVCAVALLGLSAVALGSGAKPVDSKVSMGLGPQPGQFSGAVRADDPGCVAGRKIHVIRLVPEPKEKIGKDFSDINGLWSERTDELSGSWYAKLKPERRGGLFCKGDKSAVRAAG
jgi:hypothetical protein